ncbi:esterase [Streptomyces daliensis]|uniref:Esterase n=1 Tax=Streptomyces daliensis TaxID=299421 RepID=A0A8T4IVI6_9ACTN|nr:esterase [Streptomyces daliensis]
MTTAGLGALPVTASGAPGGESAASATSGRTGGPSAVGTTVAGGARVVSEEWTDERTVELKVESPAVGKTLPVRLLLPTGWKDRPDRTWPVLYLLQGAHDDYTSWTRETDIESFTADKDVITVMPESGPTGIPTAWWNSGRGGPDYEAFILEEVTAILEASYRAGDARAVAGVSTGGYGAMAFASRHPGMFGAAAAYSGILHTRLPSVPTLLFAIVARELLSPLSMWGSPLFQSDNWKARDPYAQAEKLRGTELYISAGTGIVGGGDDDPLDGKILESSVWPTTKSFTNRLEDLDIPATVDLYTGGAHAWPYWQREFHDSWPELAKGLGLPASPSRG